MLRWHRAVQYRLVDGIHRARRAKRFALSLHARTQPFAPKNVMDERERSEHARPSITFFGLPSTLGGPELQAITVCIRDTAARTFRCRRPQCLPCAVEDRAPSAPRDPDAKDAKDALDRQQAVALVYAAQGKPVFSASPWRMPARSHALLRPLPLVLPDAPPERRRRATSRSVTTAAGTMPVGPTFESSGRVQSSPSQ